ncbi:MAG: hypothetical protein H6Q16_1626 [Bacteroidetes bacterium]|nr:hypothetical protein [Bacteroidota bacterium]
MGGEHEWRYGNDTLSTDPSFVHVFGQSNNNALCHKVTIEGYTCEKCIKFCVGDIPNEGDVNISEATEKSISTKYTIPSCDVIEANPIIIYPNPTKNDWTIEINSFNEEEIEIIVNNIEGKQIYSKKVFLKIGQNNFTIGNNTYNKGNYILSIRSNTLNHTEKLIKE